MSKMAPGMHEFVPADARTFTTVLLVAASAIWSLDWRYRLVTPFPIALWLFMVAYSTVSNSRSASIE